MAGGSHSKKGAVASPLRRRSTASRPAPAARRAASKERGDGHGVLVEVAAAFEAVVLYLLDVGGVVDDPQLLARCPAGLERHGHLGGGRVVDSGKDGGQPFGALGVPVSGGVCCEFLVSSEQHYHSTTVPPSCPMRGVMPRPSLSLATTRDVPVFTCMSTPRADRLAASRVSDRRTRPPLPSASWVSDARSALVPLARLAARVVLVAVARRRLQRQPVGSRRGPDGPRRHHRPHLPGPLGPQARTTRFSWA